MPGQDAVAGERIGGYPAPAEERRRRRSERRSSERTAERRCGADWFASASENDETDETEVRCPRAMKH